MVGLIARADGVIQNSHWEKGGLTRAPMHSLASGCLLTLARSATYRAGLSLQAVRQQI